MLNLNEAQVKDIPAMIDRGLTIPQVAAEYGVHERTINKWIKRLREEGFEVKVKKGRPKMKLNKLQ